MVRIEKSIIIKAPPEKVWEMLAWDRLLEWEEGHKKNTKSIEYTSKVGTNEDKIRIGTTAHIILKQGELDFEITESLVNEKMTYRAKGVYDSIVSYILEPIEEGIKFTYVMDAEFRSILMKIIYTLFRGVGEREVERSLENLKSIVER